jgi:hypothetical protein
MMIRLLRDYVLKELEGFVSFGSSMKSDWLVASMFV